MTNVATVQTQIKGFELAHSTYPLSEPLECIKGASLRCKAAGSSPYRATTG